jgi:hypothetical protein
MRCAVLARSAFDWLVVLLVVAVMCRWCREEVAFPLHRGDGSFPAVHGAPCPGVNLLDLRFRHDRVKLVTLRGEPDHRG